MSNPGKPVFQFSVAPPQKQNRWGVLLRIIVALPQWVFAAFLLYGAWVLTLFAWFYMIFKGRNPYQDFNAKAVRAYQRALGYTYLLTSEYPPFSLDEVPDYPMASLLEPGALVRTKVLFRLILMIPVLIVWWILGFGLALLGFVSWVTLLIRGTLPKALHDSIAAIIRFDGRVLAYVLLLQDPYPRGLFGDKVPSTDTAVASEADHVAVASATQSLAGAPETSVNAATTDLPPTTANSDDPLDEGESFVAAEVTDTRLARSWTMSLTSSAKRVMVVTLVVGTVAAGLYTAFVPHWQDRTTTLSNNISASSWNSQYRSDVVNFQNAVTGYESTLEKSHHEWTAILNGCESLQSQYAVFDSVPYYPQTGPDQNLLSGLSTLYTNLNNCVDIIAPYKVSRALPYLVTQLKTGSSDLETFLQQT
jgi:Domain of unknown function (DUF4389)